MNVKEPTSALKYILQKLTQGNKTLAINSPTGIRGIKHILIIQYNILLYNEL